MKRISWIISVLFMSLFIACEDTGSVNEYFISVDKDVIEADGRDMAVFVIKDGAGNVLTSAENDNIYFENVKTGKRLERRSVGFASLDNGEYEFIGIYRSKKTENTVTVKAQNRARYEKFHKNIAVAKITATWCTYCPNMTLALESLAENDKEHICVFACHGEDGLAVPFGQRDLGATALSYYGGTGYPSNIYDMSELSGDQSPSKISDIILSRRTDYPATCGVKVNSVVLDGNDLKISASLQASSAGSFDLACALIYDDMVVDGGTSVDGHYHNVVRGVSGNFLRYSNDTAETVAADEEMTREFTIPDVVKLMSESDLIEHAQVLILAHRKDGNSVYVDNCVICAYGESSDYLLNE